MIITLANTLAQDAAIPLSIYKPLLMALIFGGWAWIAARLDKDAYKMQLPQAAWNFAHIGAGAGALFLFLMIPNFWGGLFAALAVVGGEMGGYVHTRNRKCRDPNDRWRLSMDSIKKMMAKSKEKAQLRRSNLWFLLKNGDPKEVPPNEDPRFPCHVKLEEILDFALPRGATRFDLAVNAQKGGVLVQVDGVRYIHGELDPKLAVGMIDYMKTQGDMDVAERRKKQSGKVKVRLGDYGVHSLGLSTQGTTRELVLNTLIDPGVGILTGLDILGMPAVQKDMLAPVLKDQLGGVIVTCPPGKGQTTLLLNLLSQHDPYTQAIQTLEREVTHELEGITHTAVDPTAPPQVLANRIAALLRQDVKILMIDEVPDGQVAQVVADACGHIRVYMGMRAEDTFGALKLWAKAASDPALAASSLRAVIACRLVRRLCPVCRIAFQPDPAALKKLNLPPEKITQLYKHSGKVMGRKGPEICPTCHGIGYRGQTGVFEVMVLDDEARNLLSQSKLDLMRGHLRKQKMMWLQEAALAKVVEGATSIQEITRALGKDADTPQPIPVVRLEEPAPGQAPAA